MDIKQTLGETSGELQNFVDALFCEHERVSSIDILVRAEIEDPSEEVLEVIGFLPAGTYNRRRLCDQLNSIVTAHGWGNNVGTVE